MREVSFAQILSNRWDSSHILHNVKSSIDNKIKVKIHDIIRILAEMKSIERTALEQQILQVSFDS